MLVNLIIGLIVFTVILYFGLKFVRRIPKGAGRRKPKGTPANQTASAPEGEPGDWFSATFGGGLSGFPGLDVVFQAARDGDPDAISMARVFAQMVDNGGKLQLLQQANDLANKMFENGATVEQVLSAIEALFGSVKRQQRSARTARTWGSDSNPYGVEE